MSERAAGDPRDRQEAPGRGRCHGLARPRSLGHLGGRRAREAGVLSSRVMPASRNGPGWRARSRGRARWRWSSASPDRARPTSGASPTCRRRSSARCCQPSDLERRLDLLQACWAYFDDVAARVSAELRPGPRSAGRTRDQIIRHVILNEPEQFSRKVEVRTPLRRRPHAGRPGEHRQAYLDGDPRLQRRGQAGPHAGRSSSSSAARPTTSWTTRGRWRTGTRASGPVGPWPRGAPRAARRPRRRSRGARDRATRARS